MGDLGGGGGEGEVGVGGGRGWFRERSLSLSLLIPPSLSILSKLEDEILQNEVRI